MITLHVTSKNYQLSDKVLDYVDRKLGRLDKYLPRGQEELQGRVILEVDPSGREDNKFICQAAIEIPGPNIEAREATLNMYAAIDIVEAKLKVQIKKYKDRHTPSRLRRSKDRIRRLLRRDIGSGQ